MFCGQEASQEASKEASQEASQEVCQEMSPGVVLGMAKNFFIDACIFRSARCVLHCILRR